MARTAPTPAELLAAGRLQGIALSIVLHGRALRPLVEAVRIDDEGWRVAALVALRSLTVTADQRDGLAALPGRDEPQRAAIVAALGQVALTARMADIAVLTGNVPSFTALVKFRLPSVLGELDRAMQALTRAMLARQVPSAAVFAC